MPSQFSISWDYEPVKGRGGGPFLEGMPAGLVPYAPPWVGLRCEHHGRERIEWTPYLVRTERREGQQRRVPVHQLPTIRSCCVRDHLRNAAWWHDVEWALKLWGDFAEGDEAEELAEARGDFLASLRLFVFRPTGFGIDQFAAFRDHREAEDLARDAANRAYWEDQVHRRRERHVEEQAQAPDAGLRILGLRANATLAQVKARHRVLVLEHHPDRGGDEARFRQVQAAYESLLAEFERRAAGG